MPAITGRSSSRPRRVEITTPFYARSPVMGPPSTPPSGQRHQPSTPHTPTRSAAMPYSPDGNTPSPTAVINRMQQRPVTPSPRRFSTPRRQTYSGTPDRFIPANLSPYSFRMGSPVENLSPDERLLRRHVHGSGSRDRSSSPSRPHQGRARANTSSPLNNRLSAGTVGVFGLGVMPIIGPIDHNPPPTRQRGREVNGGIFADTKDPLKEANEHQFRLSAALGVDRSRKVFSFNGPQIPMHPLLPGSPGPSPFPEKRMWEYVSDEPPKNVPKRKERRPVPTTPFRVLDAPGMRDDYYCSLIAYNPTMHALAVGLHSDVYHWDEATGARAYVQWSNAHVTSLAFSSAQGKNSILAIGRISGSVTLWSPTEKLPRLEQKHASSIACLAWKPKVTWRAGGLEKGAGAKHGFTEDLLLGDEAGNIYLYQVTWGDGTVEGITEFEARIFLLRRIVVHTQQICGLAWSHDATMFASGGNDNAAFLFSTADIEGTRNAAGWLKPDTNTVIHGGEKFRWEHGAAVKAIAFCPWQSTLVATGGGSNDRGIHFFHTRSGVCLNTINVSAQVTSLIWSVSHREIAATLGYANPDHPVRLVVYSWPACQQIVSIPWQEDMRALYAVAYPGGPTISEGCRTRVAGEESEDDDDTRLLRELGAKDPKAKKKKISEGCLVVAASDETVRFHEVWGEARRLGLNVKGVLGGSEILESMEGIENDGMLIR